MTEAASAATCALDIKGTVTTVALGGCRKVCYEFDTSATKADLALPYRVSLNGKVQEAAGTLGGLTAANRKITLLAAPGDKIALFLNSDVHPDFRRHPVYAVQVGDNDVLVKIIEQAGQKHQVRPEVGRAAYRPPNRPGGPPVDFYSAGLTGDIWKLISHKYSEVEANAFLPPETTPAVRQAVRAIYAGLRENSVLVKIPVSDSAPKLELRVRFAEAENARANVTACSLLDDVLPRTHPCAFASLFTEACNAGITDMLVTSCWRPMLGSIAHRAGLGIDVIHIANATQKVRINRVGLTGMGKNENVSEAERKLYAEYLAERERFKGTTSKDKAPVEKGADARRETEARDSWEKERNRNEPKLLSGLRNGLCRHPSIKQVFDPWYMEVNTADQNVPLANEQRTKNEQLHAHHLHVTVREPKIL
jgi:hypothetical protein